ncbi:MAG TPA: hypothetical protein VFK26_02975 [Gemmatimonadaceae bacterium]|nr:hypothetical protein [Gemmatimonadaceae bacterium]
MGRILVGLVVVACIAGTAACADSTAPASAVKQPPRQSMFTRYILASGDVPPAGCSDLGNGYWVCDGQADPAAPAPPPRSTAPALAPSKPN